MPEEGVHCLCDEDELRRDAERVRAVEYFRLEEEKAIKVGREAAAVLQEIEESARYRACQDGTSTGRKNVRPLALQAWGSFRDVLYKYAETLSSPSKAHPQVAMEMQ
ncbi:uncharacterized protein LOC142357752, partial [Convolutriloba macropyga]|uniref:uncharacterized protein LOC142357752 n=1 Tax=Convolutriloba macropyga TaxID=536237 RepID=UPI003F520B1B